MKRKVTITLEEDLIPRAKRYAASRGVSLSSLIETALDRLTTRPPGGFVDRWQGAFRLSELDDERYRALAAKYL
ncbi:MAG: DUF6364 family protein [Gemmatimonadota bacterium]